MKNSEAKLPVTTMQRVQQMFDGKRELENLKNSIKPSGDKFQELNAIITQDSQTKTKFHCDTPEWMVYNKVKSGQDNGTEGGERERDNNYYITALNTKRNPDLLIPGGALKGNMYFRKHIT